MILPRSTRLPGPGSNRDIFSQVLARVETSGYRSAVAIREPGRCPATVPERISTSRTGRNLDCGRSVVRITVRTILFLPRLLEESTCTSFRDLRADRPTTKDSIPQPIGGRADGEHAIGEQPGRSSPAGVQARRGPALGRVPGPNGQEEARQDRSDYSDDAIDTIHSLIRRSASSRDTSSTLVMIAQRRPNGSSTLANRSPVTNVESSSRTVAPARTMRA